LDLYSSASRLGRTFAIDGRPLRLDQYGLVGDGRTCALIGVDGAVAWMCMPRFDSPALFASLLDAERGGSFRIAPASKRFEALQAYDTDTNVLQTLFRTDEATVLLTDSMPLIDDDPRISVHELHRLVEAREGRARIEIRFDPRFDFGRSRTVIETAEHGLVATGESGERITLSVGASIAFRPDATGAMRGEFVARPGANTWVVLSYRAPEPEPIGAYRPFDHLRRTRRFWRNWSSQLRYDGPWRHEILRSALTLKLLQYAPTGAVVAAPTTSLPEDPSGQRNWDYRYAWTRDSAMAIRAMSLIGYQAEARGFFHFVRDTLDARGHLDLMVTVDGADVPDETIVTHLRGYHGRGPVRIGNAARDQRQHDVAGWLVDAAYLHERTGAITPLRLWRHIRRIVDQSIEGSREPDHGIWEPRQETAHRVHSKLMAWVALDRGTRLAPRFGDSREARRWRRRAQELRREILERGFNDEVGSFASVYGGREVDASLLLLPTYGLLPCSDPRVAKTMERIRKELSEGSFLCRYRDHDGIDAEEGAFVLCGFWLAEALALAGQLDEALEVFGQHLGAANHLGLLAEEVNPTDATALGNFPQAFSHLGLIQAAVRLHATLRLRDEGLPSSQPGVPFDPPELL